MPAQPIASAREVRDDGGLVEIVIWALPEPLPPCTHRYKYRLYFGMNGVCQVRYDNERGKGDHRHIDGQELPYPFTTLDRLLADFRADIARWS